MIVSDAGAQASLENLVSDCEAFGLDPLTATDVALEIEQLVLDHWRECCTQAGLSEQAIERLATRFTGFVDGGAERSADVSADTPRASESVCSCRSCAWHERKSDQIGVLL
jgi:hypothetical protein